MSQAEVEAIAWNLQTGNAERIAAGLPTVDQAEVAAISRNIQMERTDANRQSAADQAASSASLRVMSQAEVEAIAWNLQTGNAERIAAGLVEIQDAEVGAIRRAMEANRSPTAAAQPASGEGLPPDMANYKHDPVHMQRLFAASRGEEAVSIF
jgi:hypothetical protein